MKSKGLEGGFDGMRSIGGWSVILKSSVGQIWSCRSNPLAGGAASGGIAQLVEAWMVAS